MARNKKTYIVNVAANGGTTVSYTLRDYCEKVGLNYNTALARIWRADPEIKQGVIYFNEDEPMLSPIEEPEGAAAHREKAPRRRPERKVGHNNTVRDGIRHSAKHKLK